MNVLKTGFRGDPAVQRPIYIPEGYDRILVAESKSELFRLEMKDRVNCILRPRAIKGDFNALAEKLHIYKTHSEQSNKDKKSEIYALLENVARRDDETGAAARQVYADIDALKRRKLDYELRIIGHDYYDHEPVIHSFHTDGGNETDDFGVFMCCYTRPTTAWVMNEECNGFGYASDRVTKIFTLKANAVYRHFEPGDLVRQAPDRNAFMVQGFIHAAERIKQGEPLRMLLTGVSPVLKQHNSFVS